MRILVVGAGSIGFIGPYLPEQLRLLAEMKNPSLLALAGLAISFAVPSLAQQKDTVDPQILQQYTELGKKFDEGMNNNDAPALAACFTKDAVLVTNTGPIFGREAIEKMYADLFKQMHFSNQFTTADKECPHAIGTAGNEIWGTGGWSNTIKGKDWGPLEQKGYWGSISVLEDGVLKDRMQTWNITPAPAATPSPTTTPSN
jgi:ketosteroid isomerase-like protein